MKSVARWFLVVVLALDGVLGAVLFTGWLQTAGAQSDPAAMEVTADEQAAGTDWNREALVALGRELEQRRLQIERRETELDELWRSEEVLRRTRVLDPETGDEPAGGKPQKQPPAEAFLRLQRAYENMEPDTAARALSELAARDKDAVVQLLLGWQPRTSGAILDALTQSDAKLAADLSYEIWKLGS